MPISTNAPFNEFGQSMILRDIEQLYLSMNGVGSGSAGDGQTQDQAGSATQEQDLSGLATIDYVDAAIAAISDGSYSNVSLITGGSSWSVPITSNRCAFILVGGGGGGGTTESAVSVGYIASSSGGSPTTQLYKKLVGGGGGSGAVIYCAFNTAPGSALSISIGAGGSAGAIGSSGGTTSISGAGCSFSAFGGEGGSYLRAAQGGESSVTISSMVSRPIFSVSPGITGPDHISVTDATASFLSNTTSGAKGFVWGSTNYGWGGSGGNSATNGAQGCIIAFY